MFSERVLWFQDNEYLACRDVQKLWLFKHDWPEWLALSAHVSSLSIGPSRWSFHSGWVGGWVREWLTLVLRCLLPQCSVKTWSHFDGIQIKNSFEQNISEVSKLQSNYVFPFLCSLKILAAFCLTQFLRKLKLYETTFWKFYLKGRSRVRQIVRDLQSADLLPVFFQQPRLGQSNARRLGLNPGLPRVAGPRIVEYHMPLPSVQ